jgi:hypothetical protein
MAGKRRTVPRMRDVVVEWAVAHGMRDECLFRPGFDYRWTVYVDGKDIAAYIHVCGFFHERPTGPGFEVAHNCRNGAVGCFAPLHLRWDTHAGNCRDTIADGTSLRGLRNPNTRLTEAQVLEIYARASAGEPHLVLAAEFDVERSTVSMISSSRSWAWLTGLT